LKTSVFFKAANIYVELHLKNGHIEVYDKPIKKLTALLPAEYCRIHKSYIVDTGQILKPSRLPGLKSNKNPAYYKHNENKPAAHKESGTPLSAGQVCKRRGIVYHHTAPSVKVPFTNPECSSQELSVPGGVFVLNFTGNYLYVLLHGFQLSAGFVPFRLRRKRTFY
jgi:hypothetical protein